jgi:hypothetical protein
MFGSELSPVDKNGGLDMKTTDNALLRDNQARLSLVLGQLARTGTRPVLVIGWNQATCYMDLCVFENGPCPQQLLVLLREAIQTLEEN